MTTYIIIESNERTSKTTELESFSSLKDAISKLGTHKYMAARHGVIIKEAVKSFIWEFMDQYNTAFRATYKIVKYS